MNDICTLKLIESKHFLLSGGTDQKINVWCYKAGPHIIIDTLIGHLEGVTALKYPKNTNWLFSVDSVGVVFKWEMTNFTAMGKYWKFSNTITSECIDVSSDGNIIYGPDKENPCWLRIFYIDEYLKNNNQSMLDNEDPEPMKKVVLKKHTSEVKCVKIIEKLGLIITAGKDRMILLWHIEKHCLTRPPMYDRHSDFINCLQVVEGTGYLLSGGNDRVLNIFDISSNFNLFHKLKVDCRVRALRASKDGRFVMCAGANSKKVQMVSTKFLVSQLKKFVDSKRKRSSSDEDDVNTDNENLMNISKFVTNDSIYHSKKNFLEDKVLNESNNINDIDTIDSNYSESHKLKNILPNRSMSKSFVNNLSISKIPSFFKKINMKEKQLTEFDNLINQSIDSIKNVPSSNQNFNEMKFELNEKIENFKNKLFLDVLEKYKSVSIEKIQKEQNESSVFIHDFKLHKKIMTLEEMDQKFDQMSKKLNNEYNENELKIGFLDVIKAVENQNQHLFKKQDIKNISKEFSIESNLVFEKAKLEESSNFNENELIKINQCLQDLSSIFNKKTKQI